MISSNIKPACPHFGVCGGCSLQHLDAQAYTKLKKGLVIEALGHNGLENHPVNDPIFIPAHNRRRCNLKAARIQDQIQLGYYETKSHKIVDISCCPLVVPEIERLIPSLRICLKGILKNRQAVDIFLANSDTGIDLIIEGLKSLDFQQTEKLVAFGLEQNISRISLKHKDSIEPIITFRIPVITYGGVPVECHADGFMQASALSDQILTKLVIDAVPNNTKRAVDLFCGRGTFTLPLANITKVDAVELDPQALTALEKAKNLQQKPVSTLNRNLFDDPLNPQELSRYDFAVVNPPRAGAFKQAKMLAESKIPLIVMVSCDPKTFARDAQILIQGGYNLSEITPVDQFLWSNHIEVVGIFNR